MNIKGYLDGIREQSIEGWCFNMDNPEEPVELKILINGEKVGEVISNKERLGIKQKGLHPTGLCSFKFSIDGISIEDITKIEALTIEGKFHLSNSPMIIKTNRMKICYMHIPKTAGSSLNADISLNFPGINKRTHIEGIIGTNDESILHSKNFLSGHLSFPKILEKFPKRKWDFITLLRKPLNQLESHINWLIKVTEDPKSTFSKSHGKVIHKISHELREMNLDTVQGKKDFVELTKSNYHYRNLFDNCQTKYFVGAYDRNVNCNDLYNAINVLDSSFLFVGLSEDYNSFLKTITEHYGFNFIEPKSQRNTNKSKQHFFETKEDVALIYDLMKFDNLLYEFAKLKWTEIKNN